MSVVTGLMLALLITAAIATAPSDGGTRSAFRATSVASASVTVRIIEAATIDFDSKKPEGGQIGGDQKYHRTLLINGEQVPATLVEFP